MTTETSFPAVDFLRSEPEKRRSGDDRRDTSDRRRSRRGLFEQRARREGLVVDRRRSERRRLPRWWLKLWRRGTE